jgi:hypothetical protein
MGAYRTLLKILFDLDESNIVHYVDVIAGVLYTLPPTGFNN